MAMTDQPASTVSLSDGETHVVFLFDRISQAVLTVLCLHERVQSWWTSRTSAEAEIRLYRERGLSDLDAIPREITAVIERRWPGVDQARPAYE